MAFNPDFILADPPPPELVRRLADPAQARDEALALCSRLLVVMTDIAGELAELQVLLYGRHANAQTLVQARPAIQQHLSRCRDLIALAAAPFP